MLDEVESPADLAYERYYSTKQNMVEEMQEHTQRKGVRWNCRRDSRGRVRYGRVVCGQKS